MGTRCPPRGTPLSVDEALARVLADTQVDLTALLDATRVDLAALLAACALPPLFTASINCRNPDARA